MHNRQMVKWYADNLTIKQSNNEISDYEEIIDNGVVTNDNLFFISTSQG